MSKKITLNHITKVEGHAKLSVEIDEGKLLKCELGAVEGARFFEGLVVGRKYDEIKEITSRICGICSVGHSMTSLKATENAFGLIVSPQTKLLRELMSIGERIRSHATHLYFLALPDYLGYESAIEMAPKYKKEVEMALHLMKTGNEIVSIVGGRQMHPVASVVGGFTHVPSKKDVDYLLGLLKNCRAYAVKTLKLFSKLKYPRLDMDSEHIALYQPDGLPLLDGPIVSDRGLRTTSDSYADFIDEYIVRHSTAKFAVRQGRSYVTGALARVNINHKNLAVDVKRILSDHRILFPSKNLFHNNVAQAVELVFWVDNALKILSSASFKSEPLIEFSPRSGLGRAVTEVPRGILFHEYRFNEDGFVESCNIITPTVQNLRSMEDHIREYVEEMLAAKKNKDYITLEIEKLIRAFDPCFSCSAHFLKVNWKEN
ncbi:MAG: Ni/Fe hydrogenase subunit alpha [Nanoarchaeota archaeon]|nr:Ni/Fe hydrogenase subunit alpha [Nanoarchaeota archaeon]MBU1854328.1 Ni/Fe hydrogenase subunit alpha [Nanoarchaeota archaeon]